VKRRAGGYLVNSCCSSASSEERKIAFQNCKQHFELKKSGRKRCVLSKLRLLMSKQWRNGLDAFSMLNRYRKREGERRRRRRRRMQAAAEEEEEEEDM
jgi:hypothetical protein